MMDADENTEGKPFSELAPIADAPIAPTHAISAVALNMAMKYHDISMIKDGALYQQYKLEGKNFTSLHLDHVFETAGKIEKWLIGSSGRLEQFVIETIETAVDEKLPDDQGERQA